MNDYFDQKITRCSCGKWLFVIDNQSDCYICAKIDAPMKGEAEMLKPITGRESS